MSPRVDNRRSMSSEIQFVAAAAVSAAVSEALGALAPECPVLWWSRRSDGTLSGLADDLDYPEPGAVQDALSRWAERFGLVPNEKALLGTLQYTGRIEDQLVTVWGVVNRPAYGSARS